ncbi:MAG: hypothetical protein HRU06_17445 [Oceanospirillaceae bacterium]|nr:hypothetical protein [Oceanospirillaceae bacterium]
MSIFVFIQMPRTDTVTEATEVQWQYWDSKLNCALKGATSSVEELRLAVERQPASSTILIVPGEQVRSISVSVPNSSKAALRTVPFQLEEHLSSKLEELHIVSAKAVDNNIRSLVCEHSDMQRWQQFGTQCGLSFNYLVADFSLLPITAGIGSIWSDGQRILSNSSQHQGAMTALIFQRYKEQLWPNFQEQLNFYSESEYLTLFPIAATRANSDLLPLLAASFNSSPKSAINLLQGQHQSAGVATFNINRFKAPIIATALLGITLLILAVLDNHQLQQQQQQLKSQMVSLYKQLFPNDRRINDPYAQMRGKLKSGVSGNGQHFLSWLAQVSPILQSQQISLVNLKYDTKPLVLRLQVQARDYNALETLALQINQQPQTKLQASLGTLQKSSLNNSVTSLLTLREK